MSQITGKKLTVTPQFGLRKFFALLKLYLHCIDPDMMSLPLQCIQRELIDVSGWNLKRDLAKFAPLYWLWQWKYQNFASPQA